MRDPSQASRHRVAAGQRGQFPPAFERTWQQVNDAPRGVDPYGVNGHHKGLGLVDEPSYRDDNGQFVAGRGRPRRWREPGHPWTRRRFRNRKVLKEGHCRSYSFAGCDRPAEQRCAPSWIPQSVHTRPSLTPDYRAKDRAGAAVRAARMPILHRAVYSLWLLRSLGAVTLRKTWFSDPSVG